MLKYYLKKNKKDTNRAKKSFRIHNTIFCILFYQHQLKSEQELANNEKERRKNVIAFLSIL
jgi:hypothetical protein